jgi:hypothetical protein
LVGDCITNINVIFHLVYLKLLDTLSDSDEEAGSSFAEEISKGTEHVLQQRRLRPDRLPDAVFNAIFRFLPAYKRSIDGPKHVEKQNAWREINAKLRLDPELHRQLGEQAESVLANLDPDVLKRKFNYLKHNAYAALQRGRKGSVNPLHQKMLQFYPKNVERSRTVNTVF